MNQIMALKGSGSGGGFAAAGPAAATDASAPLAVEIRALSSCGEIRPAWSDLAARALEPNLFFEPDFALAATQHLIAFRDAAAILAWRGEAGDPRRRLVGLIPCFPRNRLFVPDALIGFSDPRILNGAPLLDAGQAEAVLEAVLSLRQGWILQGRGLVLRQIDLEGPLVTPLLRAAETLGLSATLQPSGARPLPPEDGADATLRPALARQGRLALVEAGARVEARDAVELLLAMEASGPRGRSGRATLQDTREVGFLRAVTRGLSRTRQCRVGLLMLDSRPVAGAILLGRGRRRWLAMAAHDEGYASFAPERVLLAMMRQAAPARDIQHHGLPSLGAGSGRFGEVRLLPQAALRPRDLASRAREALRRGFRL